MPIKEVFIAQHAIDFRKGADGLLAEAYAMELDPYQGETVVFIHRSRRMVKVLGGDQYGVWVLLRRFEGGCLKEQFRFLEDRAFVQITQAQLAMLLEGATFEVKAKVKAWKKPASGKTARALLPQWSDDKEATTPKTSKHPSRRVQPGALLGKGGECRA